MIHDVSLSVRAGEIVGIAGLMGAGRTELAMSLFGRSCGHRISGTRAAARPADRRLAPSARAIDAGLAYVTEDRKSLGLILEDHITHNITLANLHGRLEASA